MKDEPAETERDDPKHDPVDAARREVEAAEGVTRAQIGLAERVGPYRLLHQIGEGAFGVVFLAVQEAPLRRRVAIKVIKPGMDSKRVISRFEAERQALAMMDHPCVATIFDAGATETARPYFVMEYVAGVPITEHCDQRRLTIEERLRLFIRVCEAVQHAHQKGIIHRDLKPSNILVTADDGEALPKVIDFGVAKAMDRPLTAKTILSEEGRPLGTLEYMSPEQADGLSQDIDTRSDVYALGVLLYELLTGVRPFLSEKLLELGTTGFQRMIREEDPPKPSTRLSSLGATSAASAGNRRQDERSLARRLHGDLDWIVMKCLEKDRTRRYETASSLAADLRHHLACEPVTARPPSAAYRVRKFVRRHRLAVSAASAVGVILIAAIIATTWGMLSAISARDGEAAAKAEAQQSADELAQVATFQEAQLSEIDVALMAVRLRDDLLREARTAGLEEDDVARLGAFLARVNLTNVALTTLDRNIFERALAAIADEFPENDLIGARLLQTMAETLRDVGLLDEATAPQTEAVRVRRLVLGDAHPDTLTSINDLGLLLLAQGKLAEAETSVREALEGRRRVLGETHRDTLHSVSNLGGWHRALGEFAEAERYYVQVLDGFRRALGDDHEETHKAVGNLGLLRAAQGDLAGAEDHLRAALDGLRRVRGAGHRETLNLCNNLGGLLLEQGRVAEAEPYWREVLETRRRVLGDQHPDTLMSINNMGGLLLQQRKLADAEPYFHEALEGRRRVLGDEHPITLSSIGNMGLLLSRQGKLTEAEPYYREALEIRRRLLGDGHPDTLRSMNNIAILFQRQGKLEEAESYYRAAIAGNQRGLGDDHANTLSSRINLGVLLGRLGNLAEAETQLRAAVAGLRRVLGGEHRSTLTAIDALGVVLREQGNLTEAEGFCREALDGFQRVLGERHAETLIATNNMAALLNAQTRYGESNTLLRAALTLREADPAAGGWRQAEARSHLGVALAGQEQFTEAEQLLLSAHEALATTAPGGRRAEELAHSAARLVALYEAWGKTDEAATWRARRSGVGE